MRRSKDRMGTERSKKTIEQQNTPEIGLDILHWRARAFLSNQLSYAQMERTLREAGPQWLDTELWKAAREALRAGRHEGPCDNDADPDNKPCSLHLKHYNARMERLRKALQ